MIRARLLTGFVLVALLPVIGVGISTYVVSYQNGRQQSIDRLESVAARKELAIKTWIQSLQQELQIASRTDTSPKLVKNALRLSNEGAAYAWYNNLVRIRLQYFVDQSDQFQELFLIDLKRNVVVSTNPDRVNKSYGDFILDSQGLESPYTQLPFLWNSANDPQTSTKNLDHSAAFVIVPVNDDNGELLGAIGGTVSVTGLEAILDERTGLGATGKAYLVNWNHALLVGTTLKMAQVGSDLGDQRVVGSSAINNVIDQRSNLAGIYQNPNGANVVGIYRWLPDIRVVLSVEQDASEAFQAVSANTIMNLIIALIALFLAIFAALIMTRNIADPITSLASIASLVAQGDLQQTVSIVREDEVGALAYAFNSMTTQLRDLIDSLEQRVEDRTHDLQKANQALERRALQMETSAQVGREITSILDIDTLLTRVVELIREAFGYYHVQIFLLHKASNQLVLRASSKNRNVQRQRLDLGEKSVNSSVVYTGKPLLVNDVLQHEDFLFDKGLPKTRSELVIPLRLADQVIGTLDVQNSRVNGFTEEDILVIRLLGDQIAVAIENAHLYDQSRELAVLEERNRLSRELHDSVTQSLYSLVLLTEAWRRMVNPKGDAQIEEYLIRIGEIAQQSLREMRLLIYELRPPTLEKEGLVGALQKRLDAVEKRVGIEARVLMEDFIELPIALEEGLYRIAQEALNNALKHAQATRETVRICVDHEQVVLEVIDDGLGFDPDAVEQRGGMGLPIMRERAKHVGGSLTIQSLSSEGTIVRVSVPFPIAV